VLFDMDGTLVDSEKLWDVALAELAADYGGELSLAARRAMVGTSMAESMAILHADLGQPWRDAAAGAAWLEARVEQLFEVELRWQPGALTLVEAVRAAGIPTALVTSTGRRLVDVALSVLGRSNFDVVVCGDEVEATKPHPAPYLLAARLLGVRPEACVAIEDSPTGVASARAAGIAVIAVPCEVAVPPTAGVLRVDSLADVDIDVIRGLPTPADHAEVVPDKPT
jgi:HAD superfamily hydrolase (TIGR01509 family)